MITLEEIQQDLIKNAMIEMVEIHSTAEKCETIKSFIHHKWETKGFSFGTITIIHYRLFGGASPEIYKAAASIELMILALDIFDDLQDQDNHTVPWSKIDLSVSKHAAVLLLILSMTALQSTTFEESKKIRAISYLSEKVIMSVNGQHEDLLDLVENEEQYIQAIIYRSGALLACACLVGTSLVDDSYNDLVENYAIQIGIMAQLKNDKNDISDLDGKNDVYAKKRTLPTLYLLHQEDERYQIFRDYYSGKIVLAEFSEKKEELSQLILESGCFEYINIKIAEHKIEALNGIKRLNVDNEWRNKLVEII